MLLTLCLLAPSDARAQNVSLPDAESASAAVLMEATCGARLWANNADERLAVAGLSKLPALLTLAQAFDDGSIDGSAVMRVSDYAASATGPTAFLEANEQIDAASLLKAAVMISAGDAILTLGENAYGSESVFVENINITMRQLGLSISLSDALGTNLTLTAWDLASLGAAASKSESFSRNCCLFLDSIVHSDGRETELVSANRLLKSYSGCTGLITGSSAEVGYCGVFLAERNGMRLLCAVIGSQDALARAAAASVLLDYGFAGFRIQRIAKANEVVYAEVPVRAGDVRFVDLITLEDAVLVTPASEAQLSKTESIPAILDAPLSTSVAAGTIEYQNTAGETVASVELFPSRDVAAFSVKDIIVRILSSFIA